MRRISITVLLVCVYGLSSNAEPSMTLVLDEVVWLEEAGGYADVRGCVFVFDAYLHRDHCQEEYVVCAYCPECSWQSHRHWIGDPYPNPYDPVSPTIHSTQVLIDHERHWPCIDLSFRFVEPFSHEVFAAQTVDGPHGTTYPAGNHHVAVAWMWDIDCSQIEALYWFADTPWWESDNADYRGVVEGPFPVDTFSDSVDWGIP
jgi:hypothetical protein